MPDLSPKGETPSRGKSTDLSPKGDRPVVPGLGSPTPSPVEPSLPLGVDSVLGPTVGHLEPQANHIRRDSHTRDPLSKRFTKYGGKR